MDKYLTPKVGLSVAVALLMLVALLATGIAVWHGKDLCERFAQANTQHRQYMEGEARVIATQVSTALDGMAKASEKLSELVQAMRVENASREDRIIQAADSIYTESRDIRKAALALYKELESQP